MSAMRKFLQSLSGESSPKQVPKERIDIFKALLHDLEVITRSDTHRRSDNAVIPQILNKIIQLLLEEEREAEAMQEGTAPCIEFFLQSRILELLCNLAAINKPVGMFQWIINAIARILQHMKSPLMAHSSMHKPLVRLLSTKPSRLSFEEKIEVIKLITSLAHKLKEAPIFVKLFWTDSSRPKAEVGSTSPTISMSPVMTNHLHAQQKVASLTLGPKKHFVLFKILDRIYRGCGGDRRLAEQVRRCILNCIVIDDNYNELQGYLAKQTKFMEYTMNELGKLYATLARETYSGSPNSNGYLQEYFRQLQFVSALCKIDFSKLGEDNSKKPESTPTKTSQPQHHHQHQQQQHHHKHHEGHHTATPAHAEFSQQLAESMKKLFFEPILLPGLLSDDPRLSNIHTIFARETLLQLDAPELMGALITCLVGPSEASTVVHFGDLPDDPLSESTGHSVQEALISRVEYRPYTYPLDAAAKKQALLSANTLRLFSTLFQFHPHNMYVAHNLLFRNLPLVSNPNAHLRSFRHPTEQEELVPETYKNGLDREWPLNPDVMASTNVLNSLPEDPSNVGQRFEQLLDLAPLSRQTRDSGGRPDVQTYHDYTKLRFKLARVHLLTWSSHPLSPEHVFPPPFIPEKKMEHGLQALGLKVLDHESAAESQEIPAWRILHPIARDDSEGKPVIARRLLRVLLTLLEHFLELPLDFALYLSDIFSSITQYPHLYIHRWSYHETPEEALHPSLFSILENLSARARSFMEESPDRIAKIMHFKDSVEKKDSLDGQFESTDEERMSESIVLLDEFCKEFLAILLLVDQVLN